MNVFIALKETHFLILFVLRKVGILTLSTNFEFVPDNSRTAQGIYVENS